MRKNLTRTREKYSLFSLSPRAEIRSGAIIITWSHIRLDGFCVLTPDRESVVSYCGLKRTELALCTHQSTCAPCQHARSFPLLQARRTASAPGLSCAAVRMRRSIAHSRLPVHGKRSVGLLSVYSPSSSSLATVIVRMLMLLRSCRLTRTMPSFSFISIHTFWYS